MEISTAIAYIIGDVPHKQRQKRAKYRAERWQRTYNMLLAAYKRHMGKKLIRIERGCNNAGTTTASAAR